MNVDYPKKNFYYDKNLKVWIIDGKPAEEIDDIGAKIINKE